MSDYLGEALVEKILLRLPVKCLIKCTLVCKSWRCLIKSPTFIHFHLSHAIQSNGQNDDVHPLLVSATQLDDTSPTKENPRFSLHWINTKGGEYTHKLINPLACNNPFKELSFSFFDVVGTCNGLICVDSGSKQLAYHFCTIIWNPCVRKYVYLPRPSVTAVRNDFQDHIRLAFGYDSRTNDYKVLRFAKFNNESYSHTHVEVYSLVKGSWKSLKTSGFTPTFDGYGLAELEPINGHACVNGALHWVERGGKNRDNFIVSFDMFSEMFCKILMPEALRKEQFSISSSRYRDSLALFIIKSSEASRSQQSVHMWIMKEYGVTESWTKLFTVCLQGPAREPFVLRNSGEVVLRKGPGPLLTVDPKNKQVKCLRNGGFGGSGTYYWFMDSFVESLVLLGHANAFSY